jgi:DNA-binding IclR family transcriptional regulator
MEKQWGVNQNVIEKMDSPGLQCETAMKASLSAEPSGVRVLHKTLDILEIIKSRESGFKLADLTRSVELPKATVYRILATLEGRGYLDRATDGSYRMAKKMFDLQRSESIEQILSRVSQPVMQRIVDCTKETVNLGILDGGEVVVINTVESPQAVRMSSKIGNRRHLHSTALGKIFLAGLPEKEFLRLIRMKGLPRLTPNTLVNKAEVIAEIERVHKQGYALDNQENEMEGRCIGAPVLGPDERVVAAMSISGPVFRMDLARARSLVKDLKSACAEISEAIRLVRN